MKVFKAGRFYTNKKLTAKKCSTHYQRKNDGQWLRKAILSREEKTHEENI